MLESSRRRKEADFRQELATRSASRRRLRFWDKVLAACCVASDWKKESSADQKNKLTVTTLLCYMSNTFNENLHEHISHELADNAGRESETA